MFDIKNYKIFSIDSFCDKLQGNEQEIFPTFRKPNY